MKVNGKDLQDGMGIPPTFFCHTATKDKKGSKKLMDLYPGCCRARITKVSGRMAGTDGAVVSGMMVRNSGANDGQKKVGEPRSGDLYGKT